jgi:hypothetical protein
MSAQRMKNLQLVATATHMDLVDTVTKFKVIEKEKPPRISRGGFLVVGGC